MATSSSISLERLTLHDVESPDQVPLPTEIYQDIFGSLPDDESKISTLLACRLTCTRVKTIAESPFLWKSQYNRKWKHHDSEREAEREAKLGPDWWQRYLARLDVDREIWDLLRAIATTRSGRYDRSTIMHKEYRQDSWDLLEETWKARPPPPAVAKADDNWLETSFWAGELLGAIRRSSAVDALFRLRENETLELEEGLASFCAFYGTPYEDIKSRLDQLASACRSTIPEDLDNEAKAKAICQWMRDQGFGPATGNDYGRLSNHFIDKVLDSRKSIPLSLVAIFVAIARRLGLDAHAVSFPAHVHAWVKTGAGPESIAVDVYNSESQTIIPPETLELVLNRLGTSSAVHPEFVHPASTVDMVQRVTRNIAISLDGRTRIPTRNDEAITRFWDRITASYAMATAMTCLAPTLQAPKEFVELSRHYKDRIRHVFVCDIPIVVEQTILPRLRPSERDSKYIFQKVISMTREDEEKPPRPPTRRAASGGVAPLYFVGLVVASGRAGEEYVGVITGWNDDGQNKSSDGNMASTPENPVYEITYDTTGSGGLQDQHSRYELQSDVRPFSGGGFGKYWALYEIVRPIVKDLGRFFQSAIPTASRHLWLVPGHLLADEYPDDIAAGHRFVETMDVSPEAETNAGVNS